MNKIEELEKRVTFLEKSLKRLTLLNLEASLKVENSISKILNKKESKK